MTDVLVIGAGVAGASAGYFLSRLGCRVTLLEAERSPGLHATGRSAALFSAYYGNSVVRALTAASRPFYQSCRDFPPAPRTADLLTPRGALAVETPESGPARFEEARAAGAAAPQPVTELDEDGARALCPALRPGSFTRALYRPAVEDIDTDAVHQGFLRGLRAAGGSVATGARVGALTRRHGRWHAATTAGEFGAPHVVNAAGAWAGELAGLAGLASPGLVPRRRTAALVSVPAGRENEVARWPLLCDVADSFYAKPEPGGLLLSPADADPAPPGDPRPDELGIARAMETFREVAALGIRHVRHAWAGLRTAPADDSPVIGQDPAAPGFWWLAGVGGYGFQTAPAAGTLLAALIAGGKPPPGLAALMPGVTPARFGAAPPSRH